MNRLQTVLLLGTTFLAAGCAGRTRTFDGYSDAQVWSAMVASAKAPRYEDWRVLENEVHADEATRTVHIFRVLKRTYVTPTAPPLEQSREWRFDVSLRTDEAANAPLVDFTARQFAVASHVWSEADRYFVDMQYALKAPAGTGEASEPSESK
jgi:hypothetical protein